MHTPDLDTIRGVVLDRVERHARHVQLALAGAGAVEAALLGLGLWLLDLSDRFQAAVFVLFVLSYSVLALGLVALGAHVSRVGDRVLAALAAPAPADRA